LKDAAPQFALLALLGSSVAVNADRQFVKLGVLLHIPLHTMFAPWKCWRNVSLFGKRTTHAVSLAAIPKIPGYGIATAFGQLF
jgi:hypothetical protein